MGDGRKEKEDVTLSRPVPKTNQIDYVRGE
jgi:hypothetical protein